MRTRCELLPDPLPAEPLVVADAWLQESWRLRQQPNPNAMVLATTAQDGRPSARVVLCKNIVPLPGYLVFYTNYLSRKGRELDAHAQAAAVMHWDPQHRQVRIEGPVIRAPAADSDAYFASRPWQSRLGAWASRQSEPIGSRAAMEAQLTAAAGRFGLPVPQSPASSPGGATSAGATDRTPPGEGEAPSTDIAIPRPQHWGGFQLWARAVELWVEGDARIHDRARWTRSLTPTSDGGFEAGAWTVTRLQP